MGGLAHIFYFNRGSMAKKVQNHKRHHGGVEAPQNSLELQVEASQRYCPGVDVPYYYQFEEDLSESNCYPTEASMKKLINEELSKQSNARGNAPNIVARLMGMDMMPFDTRSTIQSNEKRNGTLGKKLSKKERNGRGSVDQNSSYSKSSRMEVDSFYHYTDIDDDGWISCQKLEKPRPREHPQEEELQKFKKEFEAWQAARFKECAKVVELETNYGQLLAQEDMNKEKMALYKDPGLVACEKPIELKSMDHTFETGSHKRGDSQHHTDMLDLFLAKNKESFSRSRTLSRDFEQYLLLKSKNRLDKSSSPTRIVILKPGPDRVYKHEDSWISSPEILEEKGSMEVFLEEVRERLKCELQGKTVKKGYVVRGSGVETPYSEKSSERKQIAWDITKQDRESVTRDVGMNLPRSESTRSYSSEIQASPEFIDRDSRRFLSRRLRNIVKSETHLDVPEAACASYRSSVLDNQRVLPKQVRDTMNAENTTSCWEISKDKREMQTGSLRHGPDDSIVIHKDLSPRNLVRSLSAPVSGTSFGKLLLEDRHILTGAHIRRKLEATDTVSIDVKKQKKDRFNFKEKVSNIKYSFSLRRRLFGKKNQSVMGSQSNDSDPISRDFMSGPTVLRSFPERHENYTEVPPSPASVCSSSQEEFWRPAEYLSPISNQDVSSKEDNGVPQVFKEISSNLNELRRQLNQLESHASEDTIIEQETIEPELIELEDQAESYIRDLLIASGLYTGSWDKSLLRGDTLAKPIGNSVFEEVEESYRKLAKGSESSIKDQNEKKEDHKLLLDLLNEALSSVLGSPSTMSKFRRKLIGFSMLPPPRGKELLCLVWEIICVYLYPPADKSYYSLDSMVARDLGSIPCPGLINNEIITFGREIECLIIGDLVEEFAKDMHLDLV
ncbi:RB1-inducible coiled-coil protein [Quillaja saponaria]|uniref:RB1-inducible coiled-coil protein n=1 Tax=Quillaja saponaria TaxID=32244 RepID=A0AAD7L885_QUISA|nr:RB1-inducible coiled-coil protein [Quillaja saponaria]KAJ7953227.1 RB1-inducible coiled-coil protein [Quillaja saponaria]